MENYNGIAISKNDKEFVVAFVNSYKIVWSESVVKHARIFFGKSKGRKNGVDYIALTALTRLTTLYINYIRKISALTNVDKG